MTGSVNITNKSLADDYFYVAENSFIFKYFEQF